jgi:hypothetical protein
MITHIWSFVKVHYGWDVLILAIVAAFIAAWVCGMANKLCGFIKSFFPIKMKVKELSWTHIEREASPNGFIPHCHEYNFFGVISMFPRIKAVPIYDVYLKFEVRKQVYKPHTLNTPQTDHIYLDPNSGIAIYKDLIGDILDKPIKGNFSFQIRLEREIAIPQNADITVERKRGKSKHRVNLKFVDNDGIKPNWSGI